MEFLQADKDAILAPTDDFISFVSALTVDGAPPPPPPPPPTTGPLSTLLAGKARDLGSYAFPNTIGSSARADDSGIVINNGTVYLGMGGHGICNATNYAKLALNGDQKWVESYPTMPYSSMLLADMDKEMGRFTSTDMPYARHTGNGQFVANGRLYMMSYNGMPFLPSGSPDASRIDTSTWGGRITWFDLVTGARGYSKITNANHPYFWDAAWCYDPQTNKAIGVGGPRSGAGQMYIWLYDLATDSLASHTLYPASGPSLHVIGLGGDMVYVPSQDLHYIVQGRIGGGLTSTVWTFKYDRANPMASVLTKPVVNGAPSQGWKTLPNTLGRAPIAFGYDPVNNIIGGFVSGGEFNYFDVPAIGAPITWAKTQMQLETGGNALMTQACACLDFDAVSGCFFFLTSPPPESNNHGWAYRFKRAA